jgi:phosphatidylethanolamine-binding protein (PEBP) family uncharacterized protein
MVQSAVKACLAADSRGDDMRVYRAVQAFVFILASLVLGVTAVAGAMTLKSSDIRSTGMIAKRFIFNGFGCTGENAQPGLSWSGVPKKPRLSP